jgi:hypothetical protein
MERDTVTHEVFETAQIGPGQIGPGRIGA